MESKPIDPNSPVGLQRQIAELQGRLAATQQASLSGAGAIAQDTGDALGAGAVKVEGNTGTIVTGTQIVTRYHALSGTKLSKYDIARQVAG